MVAKMATDKDVLAVARKELGYTESPPVSNRTKYGKWFGLDGNPWCMMFIQWVFAKAGVELPEKTASCGAFMRAAQSAGRWVTGDYHPGDVVIYDFHGGAATDHCGIVTSVMPTGVRAIEGNTSTSSDANGGSVMERFRASKYIIGAYRPKYDDEEVKEVRYNTLDELSGNQIYYKVMSDLYQANIFRGKANGLDVSEDMVRVFVVNYRAGLYDAALMEHGIIRDRTV